MRNIIKLILFFFTIATFAQNDSTKVYKKRVLESTEVDFLMSYYEQDGNNASVTGGIGTEELTDLSPTIVVSIPLNEDDILTVDFGISAYTSASSSNLNPFDKTGASIESGAKGTPWLAASGASASDTWYGLNADYSHSSDDRNFIWGAHASFATEYDYTSIGFGGSVAKLFNEKNTELNIGTQVYLDNWIPEYPTELDSYLEVGEDLNKGYFNGVSILNQDGLEIDKSGINGPIWNPENFDFINDKSRNTYSVSVSLSQIVSKNAQGVLFFDLVQQKGWLSNPIQRVYFKDKENFYIGNSESIPIYTSRKNTDVFHLADDIEKLPDTRLKIPIGLRFNYFINEFLTVRTYYRYYYDDWGVNSHTANIEVPIKISDKFTLYPSFRYYTQTAADYFAPYNENISTDNYYTSDYDLSKFNANQYGFGVSYTDIFTKANIWKFGIKNVDLRFHQYDRSNGLTSWIVSGAIKFVMQ